MRHRALVLIFLLALTIPLGGCQVDAIYTYCDASTQCGSLDVEGAADSERRRR